MHHMDLAMIDMFGSNCRSGEMERLQSSMKIKQMIKTIRIRTITCDYDIDLLASDSQLGEIS